ncbi:aminomethyltransferase family protein [Rhizobiaceae bacterium BDR2-2]|uniref:Aminomethyltransferase family protein n=1 Tax=Ectorhizobium quercum TaxID=2965071 RepID=A0AAE3N192_9HYPH|nr:aminomethyltransferase family protein [Ectorhizobium quercum]MCX8998097.1 aminomethyltransferase family protein [Ectorhizobium quercum]
MQESDTALPRVRSVSGSILRYPGTSALPPGVERYKVRGGGTLVVPVSAGDHAVLTDVEGMQSCEIAFMAPDGCFSDPGLGARFTCDAGGIRAILSAGGESARRVRAAIERRGGNLAGARALRLFGCGSRPGETAQFTVQADGLLILAAPGEPMLPDGQSTLTEIGLRIRRTRLRHAREALLPEPLADPLQDIRIAAANARAYFVRAGEYIQILDVQGRQCTDFQAFSARKVDKGLDLALDSTVTRTLLGRSYPTPGLPSKAFDRDFEPLVEIVQDTVGRHDAFATACNSRYYDDMGYPGHVNCTDNFNAELAPYGIAPRKGWEALNFFYNTRVDDHNQLYLDEPWSRAGDYVLMRALTDLVCVSSSCPDDIDAANGWDPTDIHVRTYSAEKTFTRALAYRMTPDADAELTRETAFHSSLQPLTRDFVEYRGYWLANGFAASGPIEEYWACREAAALIDLSPLRKFEVTGPDSEALLQYCLTRDVRKLATGQVVYSAMCYEHGGMLDDGTLFRLGDHNFRWIGGDDYSGIWLRKVAEEKGFRAWVRSSTDQLHNIAVQGPKSRDILRDLFWTAPRQPTVGELGWFRFTVARIGGFEGVPVVVSRTGYTGELGYEIFCHPKDAAAVFSAVREAGEPHGLRLMGLQALDMLRIEAGLIFAGYDFDDQTDPFEAGIGFTVPLKSKQDDFIGREALIRRKENPRWTFVGLDVGANEAVGHGDCLHIGRARIGTVTSATHSPVLGKTIALARVDVTHAAVGTEIEIGKLDGQQKRIPAVIVSLSHYDPQKTRPRS